MNSNNNSSEKRRNSIELNGERFTGVDRFNSKMTEQVKYNKIRIETNFILCGWNSIPNNRVVLYGTFSLKSKMIGERKEVNWKTHLNSLNSNILR